MTRRAASAVVIAAALLALGGSNQTSKALQPPGAPASCSAGGQPLVESFVDSFNSGDSQQLDRLVAKRGFAWYSTDAPGERINDEAKDRSSLLAYFAARHSHNERLELRSFQFNGTSAPGIGNFEFELIRSSNDGLDSAPYGGKGAFDCAQTPFTLVLWGMARKPFLRADVPRYLTIAAVPLIALAAGAIVFFRKRRLAR